MYKEFAQVYDDLMADVDYSAWAAFYSQIMRYYGLREGQIVECACGTGNLTLELHERGYTLTGIDISLEMLWEASRKARERGVKIPFSRQDMRFLKLHRQMDGVLCTCDGLNYLLNLEQVKEFFTSAYRVLKPGGCLFFDISSEYKISNILGNNIFWEDGDKYSYVWENDYDKEQNLLEMNLSIFQKKETDMYRRINEKQIQKAYNFEELEKLLKEAGFNQISCFGDRHMGEANFDEERLHIGARKPIHC